MTKVLFFDIDGTLTETHAGVPEMPAGLQRKMRELQQQGNLLFIASGRPYAFISKTISDFGFDGMVLANGAHVELNGEFIYQQPTNLQKTINLIKHLDEKGYEYIIETSRGSYLNPEFKVLEEFFISCDINEDYLITDFNKDDVIDQCLKIEVNVPADKMDEIEDIIKDDFNYDKHGTENAFEIYSNVISKATGVQKVLEHLNLNHQDSYAFGDGFNDVCMFKVVGHPIAMGNGVDVAKEASEYITSGIYDGGIYKALLHYGIIE